jgi:hypothetical protein
MAENETSAASIIHEISHANKWDNWTSSNGENYLTNELLKCNLCKL